MSWKPSKLTSPVAKVRHTLAFRLTAAYAAAGLLLVLLATLGLYLLLVSELNNSTELFLKDKVNVVRSMMRERPVDEDGLREEVELESAARRYEQFYIRLLGPDRKPLLMTPGMADQLDMTRLTNLLSPHNTSVLSIRGRNGKYFRVIVATAFWAGSRERPITIQVAVDVSQKQELLRRFRLWFWITFAVLLVLFPFVGYQIARQGIRPVEEIATTARRITSSHLGERIAAEGYPYELAALALTFNNMLDGLEASFERISRFSVDIAHDLRTPVNNIRGEAEVALARARTIEEYRDALESSLEEAVRLSDLIGNLLFLARTESPVNHLRLESVDITELLDGVREYYDASAAEAGVTLTSSAHTQPVIAKLDRTLMQRAVGNLVSNAVAHTPEGGTVTLQTRTEASNVVIEVIDTGIGIPAEALPRVFDRFFRVDPSRSSTSGGTGLGLSIVQGIAQLHRGQVEISSKLGAGTHVTLRMPARA
jgi:two-component system, OmpR family, heavy metal sensor histidine kinase CusS